nr:Rieske (2Fe-2S) protein [Nocardiopsis alba]
MLGTAGAAAAVTAVSACGEPPDPQEIRRGHVIGQVDEVPEGGGAVFSQSKLVVTQPEKGEYKAFSASCTHGGCTVQEVEDEVIRCLCHGSEFDITSGEPVTGPAQEPLEPFTVTIDGEDIILD